MIEGTAWYQQTDTEGLEGDSSAYGMSLGMPNSEGWQGEAVFKTIEKNYFPALGFANRTDFTAIAGDIGYTWRPESQWIRRIQSSVSAEFIDDIIGRDQSKTYGLKVIEIENQSADTLELSHFLFEERLTESFEISDGVVIPAGTYSYGHACLTLVTGQQRDIATETGICEGGFYDGRIFSFETQNTWRPSMHLRLILGGEYNDVHLPQGNFITRLVRLNVDVAFNTAWSWENFLQYDNDSATIGVNSILRWIPRAGREMVLAVNSQQEDFDRDGRFRSYTADATLKLSYTFRY